MLDWDDPKIPKNYLRDDVLINLCTPAVKIFETKIAIDTYYSNIALTKTIARKIAFLYLKLNSNIPIIIMGETGVGKSILVKYLSYLIYGVVFTLDVHAG